MRSKHPSSAAPQRTAAPAPRTRNRKSHEPSTAGGREQRLKARPPARFSSLRSEETVNQQQVPLGNTLLAQRCPFSGNSYILAHDDPVGAFVNWAQFFTDGLLQVGHCIPQHIANAILDHVADSLHRVKFRAVRRQRHQMHSPRHGVQLWFGVKPCLIPEDDMLGVRVARRQMF